MQMRIISRQGNINDGKKKQNNCWKDELGKNVTRLPDAGNCSGQWRYNNEKTKFPLSHSSHFNGMVNLRQSSIRRNNSNILYLLYGFKMLEKCRGDNTKWCQVANLHKVIKEGTAVWGGDGIQWTSGRFGFRKGVTSPCTEVRKNTDWR